MNMKGNNDRGYILVTVLLLLSVLIVIGIAALGTSSIENMLSGNIRLKERNVSKADGAVELSTAVIERTVREQDRVGFEDIITDVNLPTELRSESFSDDGNTDVGLVASGQNTTVDIDKMYSKWMGGTAIEFAAGYEGVGKSGGAGFYTYYRINATGVDAADSTANVGSIYKYVPK
jgi:Tfp pilus assembly protein PilX